MKTFITALAVFLSLPAGAEASEAFYSCKIDGKLSFLSESQLSQLPRGSRQHCRLQRSTVRPKPQAQQRLPLVEKAQVRNKPAAAKKPARYPVVSAGTQKVRDQKRRQILLYELDKEQRSLKTTGEQLAGIKQTAPENEALLSHLENQQHIHQQNITAIKQELARL